jgi:hypothetical protein
LSELTAFLLYQIMFLNDTFQLKIEVLAMFADVSTAKHLLASITSKETTTTLRTIAFDTKLPIRFITSLSHDCRAKVVKKSKANTNES